MKRVSFQFFKQPAGCYLINTWAWIHHWIISWALKTLLHYCGTYLLTCNLSLVAPRRLGVSLSFRRATHHFTYCKCRSASRAACSFCEIKHISFHSYFISWIAILFVLCRRDNARDLSDSIWRNQCSQRAQLRLLAHYKHKEKLILKLYTSVLALWVARRQLLQRDFLEFSPAWDVFRVRFLTKQADISKKHKMSLVCEFVPTSEFIKSHFRANNLKTH